jgi:hypothetical protein
MFRLGIPTAVHLTKLRSQSAALSVCAIKFGCLHPMAARTIYRHLFHEIAVESEHKLCKVDEELGS